MNLVIQHQEGLHPCLLERSDIVRWSLLFFNTPVGPSPNRTHQSVNVVHLECLLDVSGDPPAIADRFPIVSGFFAS